MSYDVFISYRRSTGADDARLLQQALKARGFDVFFDYDSLRDGKFDEKILHAIDDALIFILLLSEGSLDRCIEEGDWVRTEIERALGNGCHIVPVAPSSQRWSFPDNLPASLRAIPFEQVSTMDKTSLFEESIDRIITDRFPTELKSKCRSSQSIISTVSAPSRVFVGRDAELAKLHELLSAGRIPVVTGPGGTGKSELVFQYAARYRADYPGGLFQVNMEMVRNWDDALRRLLATSGVKNREILGLEEKSDNGGGRSETVSLADIAGGLRQRATQVGRILLVLDNVESAKTFFREPVLAGVSLPQGVSIVATARTLDLLFRPTDHAVELPLNDLKPDAALELLLKDNPTDSEAERVAAENIAQLLDFRALHLRAVPALLDDPYSPHAGSYVSLEAALKNNLQKTVEDAMAEYGEGGRTPSALWAMTREALGRHPMGGAWIKLAHIAAFLSPEGFRESSLRYLWDKLIASQETTAHAFGQALNILQRHGLLDKLEEGFRMHRLTATVVRCVPGRTHVSPELLAEPVAGYAERLQKQHCFAECIRLYETALELYRQLAMTQPEAYESDVAKTLNNLANLHSDTQRLEEAEREYAEALAIRRSLASENPAAYEPDMAATLNNLAILHRKTRRQDEAEREYVEALAIRRRLALENPAAYEPDVTKTVNNLANLHSDMRRLKEAEREYAEALEIRRRLASKNATAYEPDVATTLNNLANLHSDTRRMEEAEREYAEALAIRRRLASENPASYEPAVAMSLNNLANLHRNTRRLDEAEREYAEALEILRGLASGNADVYEPDVATTLNNLAVLHGDTLQLEEAEREEAEALEIRRCLASRNPAAYEPDMAATLNNLAILHCKTRRQNEAEQEYAEALEILRRLASRNADAYEPDVATTLNNLAVLHRDTLQLEEAEREYAEALEIHRRLASENPDAYELDMAISLNNLANLHSDTLRLEEAEREYAEALAILRRLASENPAAYEPDVATMLYSMAVLHSDTLQLEEAKREYAEALEIYRRLASGNPDAYEPDMAKTLNNLAVLHSDTRRLEEAEREYAEALEIYRRLASGNPDAYEPDVAKTLCGWALLKRESGDEDDSRQLAEMGLGIYRKCEERTPGVYMDEVKWAQSIADGEE